MENIKLNDNRLKIFIIILFLAIFFSCNQKKNNGLVVNFNNETNGVFVNYVVVEFKNTTNKPMFTAKKLINMNNIIFCLDGIENRIDDSCCIKLNYEGISNQKYQEEFNRKFINFGNTQIDKKEKDSDLIFGSRHIKNVDFNFQLSGPTFIFLKPNETLKVKYRLKNPCKTELKNLKFHENNESNKLYDFKSNPLYEKIFNRKFMGYTYVIP